MQHLPVVIHVCTFYIYLQIYKWQSDEGSFFQELRIHVSGVVNCCIVLLVDHVSVVFWRALRESRAKELSFVQFAQGVADHLGGQRYVDCLVNSIRIEVNELFVASQKEIDGFFLRKALNYHLKRYPDIHDLLSLDVQFAVKREGDVESITSVFPNIESSIIGLAVSSDWLRGVPLVLNLRDGFIEISSKELEHSRGPKVRIQIRIQIILRDSLAKHVLIEII